MAKKVSLPVIPYTDALFDPSNGESKGPMCGGCPLAERKRLVGAGADGVVDIMFVSEAPSWASADEKKAHYNGKGGRVILESRKKILAADKKYNLKALKGFATYAIQCQAEPDDISTPVLNKCAPYLQAAIHHKKPKVILTFGANALRSVGVKIGGKFDEIRGRVLQFHVGDHPVLVVPTFSTRALLKSSGLYNLFYGDMQNAMRLATGQDEALINTDIGTISKDYIIPKTVAEVAALKDLIINYSVDGTAPQASAIAVDTETNTLHPERADAKVICISIAWGKGLSCAIPLWHKDAPWTAEELPVVVGYVREILACPKPKMLHGAKFDLKFLELRHGLLVHNVAWCSLLVEHLLREDQSGSYSLKILGRSYFPEFANYADKIHDMATVIAEEDVAIEAVLDGFKKPTKKKKQPKGCDPDAFVYVYGKKELSEGLYGKVDKLTKKQREEAINYENVPIQDLLVYAAIDTDLTRRLSRHQYERMALEDFEAKGRSLLRTHALPASRTLGGMEFRGIKVDQEYLGYLDTELGKLVVSKAAELQRLCNPNFVGEFNPNSSQQVGRLLFSEGVIDHTGKPDVYYIPGVTDKNEKTGAYPTNKKTLRAVVEWTKVNKGVPSPFVVALLDYRAAFKGKSGFLAELRSLSEADGRIHTNFSVHGTATGRLSSSHPNMQNQSKWIANFNFKKLFVPDDPVNELILNLDYKGAEVKIFAAYSRDPKLIEALNAGLDTHCFFVEQVYGIPYDEVLAAHEGRHPDSKRGAELKALRDIIKRVVFGTLYGAGPKKIAETAGVPMAKAQEVIELLFNMFPSIRKYVEATKQGIRKNGMVETFFGRRRRFPLYHVNSFFRSQADRRGVNMLIQSTSSDIVLGQLVELDRRIHEVEGRLCLTVHDSMVAVVPKKYVEQLPAFLNEICVKQVSDKYSWLPTPFSCDIEVGPNYGECVAIEHYIQAGPVAAHAVTLPAAAQDAYLKSLAKQVYKATMIRLPDAYRALNEEPDLTTRLEETFEEEALEELRDFENANRESDGVVPKIATIGE